MPGERMNEGGTRFPGTKTITVVSVQQGLTVMHGANELL